jgi:hypothetical protein
MRRNRLLHSCAFVATSVALLTIAVSCADRLVEPAPDPGASGTQIVTTDGPLVLTDSLECALQSVAVDEFLGEDGRGVVVLSVSTLAREPSLDEHEGNLVRWLADRADLAPATWTAFRDRTRTPTLLGCALHPARLRLTRQADLNALRAAATTDEVEGFWTAFKRQFPRARGVLRLSKVGLRPDGRQAMFEVSFGCGCLCGHGGYVIVDRDDAGRGQYRFWLRWVS